MAMGSLFENYDPVGSLNGMFAPAYIHGFAPSEAAVGAWNKANAGLTSADIEATRMPNDYQAPGNPLDSFGTMFGRGGTTANFGDPRGTVDPEALRVAAQGGKYDINARRNAIAAKVAANAAAQPITPSDPRMARLASFDPSLLWNG